METSSSILNFLENVSDESENNESIIFQSNLKKNDLSFDKIIKSSTEPSEIKYQSSGESDFIFSDVDSKIILSVYWKRGKLGASYYTWPTSELYILNDITDVHPDFNNLKTLINQVQPSQLLTYGGLSDVFLKCLSEVLNEKDTSNDETNAEVEDSSKKIFFMSSRRKDLGHDSCKRYILGLKLGFEPDIVNEKDHLLFVNSHIDLAQKSMVISLGMLIKFLENYLPQINLNHVVFQITFIKQISLANLVSIDESTFKALQIFNTRVHPSAFKRNSSGSNKEGLSLFGIFNRCKSNAGIKKMREIFLNPNKNIDELNDRLDAVEFCCKPQHQHIVQNMLDCIKRVESVTSILTNIYRTRANVNHWSSLYSSLYNAILVGEICRKHCSNAKLLKKISESITRNVHEVAHYLNKIIDFEESSVKNHFTVREGIDSKLDLLRQKYAQLPEVLVKVAQIELEDLPSFIERCSIIYITELGYLLSVPVWRGDGSDISDYTLPNFEVKFIVNNYIHYKTPRCAELDDVLGDSVAAISDVESKIMISLIQFVHLRIPDIVKTMDLIAELDCVISLAVVASENNYRRPILTKDRELEIIQGRHPLQELCVDNFVPNDTTFESDQFTKILTGDTSGPNASGKSVYLKQVALIAYLAHIGSFVPAQSATIGILDYIHSRMQSVESISTRMSAFLIDLKQMSFSLYNSSPRTIIVIDEFGKGTTEIDGLSLFAASLIHFIGRKKNCPYILASTHFHRLPSLLPSTHLVHLQYMDYLIEKNEIIYLYKIKNGTADSSLTHLAAKAAGLSAEAIERSLEIYNGVSQLKANPKLKITKNMMKEIFYMKRIFQLTSSDSFEESNETH